MLVVVGAISVLAVLSFWQGQTVPATVDISNAQFVQSVSVAQCSLTDDSGTLSGTLSIFHYSARFDLSVTNAKTQLPEQYHLNINRDGDAFVWKEGNAEGGRGDYGAAYKLLGLSSITHVDCHPWYIPDPGLFFVPDTVSFKQTF